MAFSDRPPSSSAQLSAHAMPELLTTVFRELPEHGKQVDRVTTQEGVVMIHVRSSEAAERMRALLNRIGKVQVVVEGENPVPAEGQRQFSFVGNGNGNGNGAFAH